MPLSLKSNDEPLHKKHLFLHLQHKVKLKHFHVPDKEYNIFPALPFSPFYLYSLNKRYKCHEMADNKMAEFKQYIGNLLRQKEHVLSKEIEKILSMTGEFSDTADDVYSMSILQAISL